MNTSYLSDMNDLVSLGKVKEFMDANELVFNESILNVANEIVSKEKSK